MPNKKHLITKPERIRNKNPEKVPRYSYRKFAFALALAVLTGFLTGAAQAQMLYVKEKNDTQSQFQISEISKITFAGGSVQIYPSEGNISIYTLEALQYISFSDFSTHAFTARNPQDNNILLYPNPAKDNLKVIFEQQKSGKSTLAVTDIQGRVLIQKEISCHAGKNNMDLNIQELPAGMYFFRLQNQYQLATTNFLKH